MSSARAPSRFRRSAWASTAIRLRTERAWRSDGGRAPRRLDAGRAGALRPVQRGDVRPLRRRAERACLKPQDLAGAAPEVRMPGTASRGRSANRSSGGASSWRGGCVPHHERGDVLPDRRAVLEAVPRPASDDPCRRHRRVTVDDEVGIGRQLVLAHATLGHGLAGKRREAVAQVARGRPRTRSSDTRRSWRSGSTSGPGQSGATLKPLPSIDGRP